VARLRSSSTKGGAAELGYDLVDPDGTVRAHVTERPRDVVVSDGSGILQEFEVTAPKPAAVSISLALARDPALPMSDPEDWRTEATRDWILVRSSPTATIAVRFRLPERGKQSTWSIPSFGVIDATIEAGPTPVTLRRIAIARGPTSKEQLEKMSAETKELR